MNPLHPAENCPLPAPPDWQTETVFFRGDEYFASILSAIEQTKFTLDVETYIFTVDAFARTLEEALIRAARRGIRVRLIVDGIGGMGWIGNWHPDLLENVDVRIFHPLRWPRKIREPGRFLARVNRRNHRKTFIADGQIAWVGSMNITQIHLEKYVGREAWRDTGVCVEGEDVHLLTSAFEHAWARSHPAQGRRNWRERFQFTRMPKRSLVRLNFTRTLRRRWRHELRQRIASSQSRVWITNPYFAPATGFLNALIRAARNGSDIRIILPRKTDVFFMRWIVATYYGPLLNAGVRIYEYLPCILHAKTSIIDSWATVGTSNLNNRSLSRDLEVDIVVTQPETLRQMEEQFARDLANSEEIVEVHWQNRLWVNRLGRFFIWLLRNWL